MDQLSVIWTSAQCGFKDWQDLWGDPWFSGTVLFLSYALTGILLLRSASDLFGRERFLWGLCGVIFVFQAFNTPLDLHGFAWTFGKCVAKAQGWYDVRGPVQEFMLKGLLITVLVVLATSIYIFRRNVWRNGLLLTGVLISVGFTIVKGISLKSLAALYTETLGPFFIADWIELFGIFLTLIAVIHRKRRYRRHID